jgi:hypothetical protein
MTHKGLQLGPQLSSVFFGQINLVVPTVEAELDCFRGRLPAEVIDQDGLDLLRHQSPRGRYCTANY